MQHQPQFFDAEGMRFHLPAYMLADLDGAYVHGIATRLTDIGELRAAQLALLSPAQRAAVRSFLECLLRDDRYLFERPNILRAIGGYWRA